MHELNDGKNITAKLETFLNGLTFEELIFVNRVSADKIRLMQKAGALYYMTKFNVGDTVRWTGHDGLERSGQIIRLNQKTASIKTAEGQWNVPPHMLSK